MMLKLERKNFWIIGLCAAILSFILFAVGMNVYSEMPLSVQNYMAYMVFSLIVGVVAAALIYFRLKIAFLTFSVGLVLGFILMFNAFVYNSTGWGDLIGIINLMMWTILGLVVGLLIQLGIYLYKRFKKNN
jgi:hypothetical protein